MPVDLSKRAAVNSAQRVADAKLAMDSDATGTVRGFSDHMSTCAMATTVTANKLLTYSQSARILSTWAVTLAAAQGDEEEARRELRRRATDRDGRYWYADREAFEAHWEHGHEFVYWTLVSDGPGLAALPDLRYGDFCLVVAEPNEPPPLALGVFPGNSAERYAHAGVLDVAACEAEATAWIDRGALLTVKHADAVLSVPRGRWGSLICSGGDYAEVVRSGELTLVAIIEVRIVAQRYKQLESLLLDFQSDPDSMDADCRIAAKAYDIVNTWRRDFGVRILAV